MLTRALILTLILISVTAYGEKVSMIFGQSLSPYIIEKDESGAELLIIKESLALEGYELVPIFTSLGRVPFMFDQGKVDAAHRYISSSVSEVELFYGNVTIQYHDVFFTLKAKDIKINSPDDLKNYSLLSFEDAHKHYPRWLPKDYRHSQTSTQINQVKLLQLGLTDIVLSDKNIFNYHVELYKAASSDEFEEIQMHIFTPPYKYKPVFKSKKVANAFNRGLKKIKLSGRYAEIKQNFFSNKDTISSVPDITQ